MLDRNEALALVLKGCSANFEANDFKVKVPENIEKGDAPIFTEEDNAYLEIEKNSLVVRLVSHDNILDVMEQNDIGEFKKVSSNLFDLEDFT